MGLVYADIELVSTFDLESSRRGLIKSEKVKKISVTALVDSGAYMLAVNETIKAQLDLQTIDEQLAELANGHVEKVEIVGPVEVIFENRSTTCRAVVLPGDAQVLLGAMPMEDLDVIIDPRSQQLKIPPERPYLAKKSLK